MDAAEALRGSGTDQEAGTIGPYLRRYGIYICKREADTLASEFE